MHGFARSNDRPPESETIRSPARLDPQPDVTASGARTATSPSVPRTGPGQGHGLSSRRGLRPSQVPVQPVSAGPAAGHEHLLGELLPVDDRHEREADAAARQVVGPGGIPGTRLSSVPVTAADGARLPDELRAALEPRFGADLGGVRVHTGTRADQLSNALNASAFTTGRDVFFRHGTYAPGSPAGQQLLAHELAHVVQQGAAERTAAGPALGAVPRGVLQRAVIPSVGIDGLAGNLDTSHVNASRAQIDQMWNGGKRRGLAALWLALRNAPADQYQENNEKLRDYINGYLGRQRGDDPMAGNSGVFEQVAFDWRNVPGDETGITQAPGQGEQLPVPQTPLQGYALAVRSWQIGDIVDRVSWSTLAAHLQGRLAQRDYVRLGDEILAFRDAKNRTDEQHQRNDAEKEQIARASCVRVSQEIRVGLNNLPTKPGVSYRAATAAVGVYGTAINVGDLIRDRAFWSTAGLRQSHLNIDFGSEGTLQVPKVYYIVNGRTGVFLPRYTNREVGVREVLYRDQTIFRVTKITNYADRTFFVWVDEVDPATLVGNPQTRNPWSGAVNP